MALCSPGSKTSPLGVLSRWYRSETWISWEENGEVWFSHGQGRICALWPSHCGLSEHRWTLTQLLTSTPLMVMKPLASQLDFQVLWKCKAFDYLGAGSSTQRVHFIPPAIVNTSVPRALHR